MLSLLGRQMAPEALHGAGWLKRWPFVAEHLLPMTIVRALPKTLDTKTKELIALGIGIAIPCDDGIAFHLKAAGATREEIGETLGMAIYIGEPVR